MPGKRQNIETPLTPLVEEFLDDMLDRNMSKRSAVQYSTVLYRFCEMFPELGARDLNGKDGAIYIKRFLASCSHLKPNTRHAYRSTLGSFTKYLTRWDHIDSNPIHKLSPIKRDPPSPKPMPASEVQRLIDGNRGNPRDHFALLLLARRALRRNELRVLKMGDFRFDLGYFTVQGKGGKPSNLPLMSEELRVAWETVIALDSFHEADDHLLYTTKRVNLPHVKGRLVPTPHKPKSLSSMDNWFRACLLRADVPPIYTMHTLRHACLTMLQRVVGNVALTQRLARHSSPATTLAYYVATSAAELTDAMSKLDAEWNLHRLTPTPVTEDVGPPNTTAQLSENPHGEAETVFSATAYFC